MTQHLLVSLLFLHLFLHNEEMLRPAVLSAWYSPVYTIASNRAFKPSEAAQNKVVLSGMQHLNKDRTTTVTQKGIGVISQWTVQISRCLNP